MRDLAILFVRVIATIAKLMGPGGARAVVAEFLLVRHQLVILNRGRERAPNLRPIDRVIIGLCAVFMRPSRIAVVLKASTLLGGWQLFKPTRADPFDGNDPATFLGAPCTTFERIVSRVSQLMERSRRLLAITRIARSRHPLRQQTQLPFPMNNFLDQRLTCVCIRLPGIVYTIEIDPRAEKVIHWEWQSV